MKDTNTMQQAVSDVAMIRKAIERAQQSEQPEKARLSALDAKILVQAISLFFALGLAIVELVSGHFITESILQTTTTWEFVLLGIGQVAVSLAVFVMCLYFIVWRSARHGEQEVSKFIAQNFTYLRSLSLVADLLIKFIVFSLVLIAQRADWLAPLLLVFTADYLFQGRFFNLPLAVSLAAGLGCIGLAALVFFTGNPQVVWPLLVFAAANAASLVVLVRARKPKNEAA